MLWAEECSSGWRPAPRLSDAEEFQAGRSQNQNLNETRSVPDPGMGVFERRQ
jgi:hypothetical protein